MPEEETAPTALARFDPSEAHIQAYRGEIAATVAEAKEYRDSKEPAKLAADQLAKIAPSKRALVKMRNQIENGRLGMFEAERKQMAEKQAVINGAAKKLQAMIASDEAILTEAIQKHEWIEWVEAEAKVKAEEEKKAAEAKKVADELAAAQKIIRDREEAERQAERDRMAAERAAFEAEQTKRRAELAAEAEKQAAAQREAERLLHEERERHNKIAIEQERIAKAQRDEAARLERIEFERQTRERAEAHAKAKAEEEAAREALRVRLEAEAQARDEAARIEREAAEKKEAEAAKPDKERMKLFGQMLGTWVESNQPATFQSKAAKDFASKVVVDLRKIVADCKAYTGGKGARS